MSSPFQDASSDDDDNVVGVDAEGNVVPSNAEASLAVSAVHGDCLMVHDATDEWYLEGMRECLELRARLDTVELSSDEESEADVSEIEEKQPEDQMGNFEWSREYSDASSDVWVLEALLKRRVSRHSALQTIYDDDNGEAVTPNLHEYLCKWKWYREPTWEIRGTLEELGYLRDVDAFDATRRPNVRSTNRQPPKKRKMPEGMLETLMGDRFPEKVFHQVRKSGLSVTRYAAVGNRTCESRFIKAWKEKSESHCPMMLFHGTRGENIQPIAALGLVVPSQTGAVRVAHGSAYGVGIYAAKNALYSTSYTDCNKMFVCLGLVGPQYTTMKECGDICVFFDPSLIVPLWVIEYEKCHDQNAITTPPIRETLPLLLLRRRVDGNVVGGYPLPHSAPKGQRRQTKRMIKQQPRYFKELYKQGVLLQKKTS
jgi:hypothetical protein